MAQKFTGQNESSQKNIAIVNKSVFLLAAMGIAFAYLMFNLMGA